MLVFYTMSIVFIVLTGYFFAFPLHKKRPVLIKEDELVVYFVALAVALLQFFHIWIIVIAVLIILFLYVLKPWFVYGVTRVMLSEALEKAALATKAPIEKLADGYTIDGSIKVKQYNLAEKIIFISFEATNESKKAKLTMVVYKKFILNYFTS